LTAGLLCDYNIREVDKVKGVKVMKRTSLPVKARGLIIDRDKATCQVCGKVGTITQRGGKPAVVEYTSEIGRKYDGKDSISFEFHHKTPVFLDGADDLENIELRCRSCNRREKFTDMMRNYLKKLDETKSPILTR